MDKALTITVATWLALIPLIGRAAPRRPVAGRRWLSFGGGVSSAYVFVHLLPEVAAHQARLLQQVEASSPWRLLEAHAYLASLLGLMVFLGLERAVRRAERPQPAAGGMVFWIHLLAFAAYNGLVSFLLVEQPERDLRDLLFYAAAMGLHVYVNDERLRTRHGDAYHRSGRWLLAAAPLLGLGLAAALTPPPALVSALFAFLAGGIILNILKDELPDEPDSQLAPFLGGALVCAGLLLATG